MVSLKEKEEKHKFCIIYAENCNTKALNLAQVRMNEIPTLP
jgi:hypothetical protein